MKKITIKNNEKGLVFKNNALKKVIDPGTHWFFFGEKVQVYNVYNQFAEIEEGIFEHNLLKNHLDILEVKDDELALVFEKSNFKHVFVPGVYAFWKGQHAFSFQTVSLATYEIKSVSKTILEKPQMNSYVRNYRIESFEKGLLFVNGVFEKMLDPGNYFWWKNNQIVTISKGDIRVQPLEILGQEILTKDKVQLRLNFAVQYQLTDFEKAFVATKDYEKQLYVLVQMALRTLVGGLTFDELMDQKNKIAEMVFTEIVEKSTRLGISIIDTGLKDVILPGEIREIMNQVLIAEKKAQANSIMRREETAATRSLLNTAKLMEENLMLFKLKEMEYIEKIADKINTISVSGSNNIVSELKQIFTK